MHHYIIYIVSLSLCLLTGILQTNAQELLSLEQAIELALAHNQQIKVSQYDAEVSALQVDPSIVGRSPVLDFNANYTAGWSDASIETLPLGPTSDGDNTNDLEGFSHTVALGPELVLLLYDGKASRYRLQQLGRQNELAKLQLQQTIENTLLNVINAYVEVARQQSLMSITRQNVLLSKDRLERAVQDASYGTSSSLDQLDIEVDLKTDSVALRNQVLQYENARRDLTYLLGNNVPNEFEVDSQLYVNTALDLNELASTLQQNNTLVRLVEKNVELADLELSIAKAAYRPYLQGFANVNYSYIQNEASFLQTTRTIGPNAGVRLNVPILDGGARRIQRQSAQLNKQKALTEQTDVEAELLKELNNAYATYQNTLEQLRIEKSNLASFERNLENMQNQFALGLVTNTDVRRAQLNLNSAQNRVSNYQYTLKQVEVILLQLSGQLVEQ